MACLASSPKLFIPRFPLLPLAGTLARLESSKLSHRDARTGAGIAAAIVVVGFGLLWSLISGDVEKLDEKM